MKDLVICIVSGLSFLNVFSQNSIEIIFGTIPFHTNFTSKLSEFENRWDDNTIPFQPSDIDIRLSNLYNIGFQYHYQISKNFRLNAGINVNRVLQSVKSNSTIIYDFERINTNVFGGLGYVFNITDKNKVFVDFNYVFLASNPFPLFGNIFADRKIDYDFSDNPPTFEDIRRSDLWLKNDKNSLSFLVIPSLSYQYSISEKSSIGINFSYITYLRNNFYYEFESAWKRPGENFFTKVEKTESSRFNFGFMNVGVSYVYHFKMKE